MLMGDVQVGRGGVGGRGVGKCSDNGGVGERFLSKLPPTVSLTEGAVTTEAGSLFQYFTTLTENADPPLRRWLAPWSTS